MSAKHPETASQTSVNELKVNPVNLTDNVPDTTVDTTKDLQLIESVITAHQDFPSAGVVFRDIFPIFRHPLITSLLYNNLTYHIQSLYGNTINVLVSTVLTILFVSCCIHRRKLVAMIDLIGIEPNPGESNNRSTTNYNNMDEDDIPLSIIQQINNRLAAWTNNNQSCPNCNTYIKYVKPNSNNDVNYYKTCHLKTKLCLNYVPPTQAEKIINPSLTIPKGGNIANCPKGEWLENQFVPRLLGYKDKNNNPVIDDVLNIGGTGDRECDLAIHFINDKPTDYYQLQYSRGFILAPPLAVNLHAGFVPVRKAGKLPGKCHRVTYTTEYSKDETEIQIDSIKQGQRCIIVDDLLATGGTLKGAIELVNKCGGIVVECLVIVELVQLKGREKLGNNITVHSMFKY